MFNFKGFFVHGVRPHIGAFLVVTLVIVVFLSAPFLLVWSYAKRVPVVGDVLKKVPGAAA